MEDLYYYHSIRKTIVQFLDLFNGINIAKYNKNNEIVKLVKVPIKLAPKEKFLYWINNQKSFERRFPIMGVSMTSIAFDSNRLTNNIAPINYGIEADFYKHSKPVPYNLSFKLQIATQYIVEMDQILEQILPFFDPYVEIRIPLPEYNNEYNVKVLLQNASQNSVPEKGQDEYRIILWELDFVVHGYLLKPTKDSIVIKKIIERYYTNKDSFALMQTISPSATDSLPLSANHDFDSETLYIKGLKNNQQIEVEKFEIFEGN